MLEWAAALIKSTVRYLAGEDWQRLVHKTKPAVVRLGADDFAGKSIALLVFIVTFLNPFFQRPLVDECICCLKILMSDNRLVVIDHHVLVHFPVIFVPIEIIISISLLENHIACVFLIC